MQNMTQALLERRLSLIVEHFPIAVLLETVDRKVSQTNQAFCDMFGIPAPPEALVGADCEEAAIQLAPLWGDLDSFLARVHEVLDAREPVVGDRLELTDGRVLERDFLMVPVDETRGEAAWIYRDVTASDTARREAQSEAEARSELLATISHDVRATPVVGIVGMVDILLQQPLDHRTRELVESVQSSAAAMTAMLDDLLDLSRADAGRLELSIEETSICDVVEDVAGMVGPIAQAKSLPLIAGVTVALPDMVRTDPGRLRQVLLNLVSNAVKFSPSGAVSILAHRRDRTSSSGSRTPARAWRPRSSTGPSSSTSRAARASTASSRARTRAGHCQRATAALGGSIDVGSRLGLGSTFTVRIPDAVAGPSHRPTISGIRAHITGHRRAVPVVAAALERAGIEVRRRPTTRR